MKFTCEWDDLCSGIGKVINALSNKTAIPALEGILLKADDTGLSMTCTDLNLTITTHIAAMVQENGEIVIPGKLFSDIVHKLPQGEVSVEMEEGSSTVLVRGKKARFTLPVLASALDYPMMPEVNLVNPLVLTHNQLRGMIRATQFACAVDDSKPIFTGALFEVQEDTVTIVALDGYRLAMMSARPKNRRQEIRFVVPSRYLTEISRQLNETEEEVTLYVGQNQLVVDVGVTRIIARLLEGEYIKYQSILPKEYHTRVKVNAKQLLESVDRASLMASIGKNNLVKLDVLDDELIISSKSESGELVEELEVEMTGKELKIAFNANYLMQALRAIGEKEVYLDFTTGINPCVITAAQEGDFYYLVLPVRIYGA